MDKVQCRNPIKDTSKRMVNLYSMDPIMSSEILSKIHHPVDISFTLTLPIAMKADNQCKKYSLLSWVEEGKILLKLSRKTIKIWITTITFLIPWKIKNNPTSLNNSLILSPALRTCHKISYKTLFKRTMKRKDNSSREQEWWSEVVSNRVKK